ncbi:Uma2 family endonuclease [Paludisphaera soli]|uniref:Uma2 family endonuclease n=1 Tax=Paludisphaera soli TaxID=2712865 RepID=UPI0013EB395B|nr:Uma2 family endonuclease [Paludisphaera soli]
MATDIQAEAKTLDADRRPYRFTADQLWRMLKAGIIPDEVDVELLRGRIYRMTKREPHCFAVGELADRLRGMLPDGFHVREEKPLSHDQRSIPEPDVAVVRGARADYRLEPPSTARAALLVEVCASTRTGDYRDKVRLYASAGVPTYWVVDVDGRKLDVYSEPQGSGRDASYARHAAFPEGEAAPVILDGREVGRVAARDLLPPLEQPSKS